MSGHDWYHETLRDLGRLASDAYPDRRLFVFRDGTTRAMGIPDREAVIVPTVVGHAPVMSLDEMESGISADALVDRLRNPAIMEHARFERSSVDYQGEAFDIWVQT